MKNIKKIGAMILALVLVLSLGVTAFAAEPAKILDGDNKTGVSDNPDSANGGRASDAFNAVDNTLSLNKSIVFINDDTTNVYEPNIVYTYTISNPDVTAEEVTVTDEHSETPAHTAVVYGDYTLASVVTGSATTTTSTVTFADGNAFVEAKAAGTEVSKPFTFTFTPSGFPHTGVFRFLITESVGMNAREIAGVVSNATYSATRYLDVYVRNDGAGSYEIYGYVLFEASNKDQDITNSTTKSNGWVNTAASGAPTDVDVYTTYNAYVQKHVSGSLADQTNAFPFTISLDNVGTYEDGGTPTNLGRTTKICVAAKDAKAVVSTGTTSWTGNSSVQASNTYVALNGGTSVTVTGTIKHAGEIGFYGIPADSRITKVEETNNTYDIYTASAKVTDGDGSATTKNIDYKAASSATDYTTNVASAPLNSTGLAKLNAVETFTAKKVVDFTNTITEISPTGVVLRVAPYALILAAGVVLLMLSKKRRTVED